MTLGAIFETLGDGALAEAIGHELAWPTASRAACLWPYWAKCTGCKKYGRLVTHPSDEARSTGKADESPGDAWCVYCWESYLLDQKAPERQITTADRNAAREVRPLFFMYD